MKKQTDLKSTKSTGDKFEKIAIDHLRSHDVEIITTNYFSKSGEIDIIGIQNGILIFCEVRSRSNTQLGSPEETITPTKQRRIKKTANYFLLRNQQFQHTLCRFDVIGIVFSNQHHTINWLKNAFN
jgi:putative endonuclease